MRYMDLEGHTHKVYQILVDVDIIMRVFYKKFTYQMSINRGRMTKAQGSYARIVGILSFLIFLSR